VTSFRVFLVSGMGFKGASPLWFVNELLQLTPSLAKLVTPLSRRKRGSFKSLSFLKGTGEGNGKLPVAGLPFESLKCCVTKVQI